MVDQIFFYRVVVGLFIIFTLVLGLRTKKARTMEEYALAGRSLGGGVLLMTIVATDLFRMNSLALERSFSKRCYVTLTPAFSM